MFVVALQFDRRKPPPGGVFFFWVVRAHGSRGRVSNETQGTKFALNLLQWDWTTRKESWDQVAVLQLYGHSLGTALGFTQEVPAIVDRTTRGCPGAATDIYTWNTGSDIPNVLQPQRAQSDRYIRVQSDRNLVCNSPIGSGISREVPALVDRTARGIPGCNHRVLPRVFLKLSQRDLNQVSHTPSSQLESVAWRSSGAPHRRSPRPPCVISHSPPAGRPTWNRSCNNESWSWVILEPYTIDVDRCSKSTWRRQRRWPTVCLSPLACSPLRAAYSLSVHARCHSLSVFLPVSLRVLPCSPCAPHTLAVRGVSDVG